MTNTIEELRRRLEDATSSERPKIEAEIRKLRPFALDAEMDYERIARLYDEENGIPAEDDFNPFGEIE